MNKKQFYGLLVLLALEQFALAEISLEDIVTGIRIRQDSIESVKLDFSYEYFQPTHESFSGDEGDYELDTLKMLDLGYETLRLDKKIRVKQIERDLTTGNSINLELVAWDGKVRTAYVEDLIRPGSKPGGTVKGEMGSFYSGYWPTAMEMWVFDVRKPLTEILDVASLELNGVAKIGNYDTVKLTAKNFFGDSAILEVWVAPKKDFAPVKLRLVYHMQEPVKDVFLTMDNVKLAKKGDVWVIMESAIKVVNPNTSKKIKGQISYYKASDYQLSIPIDEKMFKIDFPRGTRVYDGILQQGYVVGEGMFVGDANGGGEYIPFEQAPESSNQKEEQDTFDKKKSEAEDLKTDSPTAIQTSEIDEQIAVVETSAPRRRLFYGIGILVAVAIIAILGIKIVRERRNG